VPEEVGKTRDENLFTGTLEKDCRSIEGEKVEAFVPLHNG
jgi:hypothetical protein